MTVFESDIQSVRLLADAEIVHSLVEIVESKLFNCVRSSSQHVLYQLLPLKGYWL